MIKEEKKRTCDFQLRKGGVTFLPLDVDVLLAALRASVDGSQTQFIENGELAAVRENLQRIRSMKLIRVPEEAEWLAQIHNTVRQLLDKIWGDSTIEIGMAEKMSNWVFDALNPITNGVGGNRLFRLRKGDITEQTKEVLLLFISSRWSPRGRRTETSIRGVG